MNESGKAAAKPKIFFAKSASNFSGRNKIRAKTEKANICAGAGRSEEKPAKIPAAIAEIKMIFLFFKNKKDAIKKAKIKFGEAP